MGPSVTHGNWGLSFMKNNVGPVFAKNISGVVPHMILLFSKPSIWGPLWNYTKTKTTINAMEIGVKKLGPFLGPQFCSRAPDYIKMDQKCPQIEGFINALCQVDIWRLTNVLSALTLSSSKSVWTKTTTSATFIMCYQAHTSLVAVCKRNDLNTPPHLHFSSIINTFVINFNHTIMVGIFSNILPYVVPCLIVAKLQSNKNTSLKRQNLKFR